MRGWKSVAQPLAACLRIVLYDRPGIGRSGPYTGPSVRLADTVADQLAALLKVLSMPPPYILVGHSLGASMPRRSPGATRRQSRPLC
jgi:pimeloyl-ACP methyl ester carboxylesterase